MSKIDLPLYRWFASEHEGRLVTNVYSGSSGTLPDQGCMSVRTWNFRVFADVSNKKQSECHLIAESYILQPWSCGGNKTNFERAEFESSEKGVNDAEEWLGLIAAKYGF